MERRDFVLGSWQQREWRGKVITALFFTGSGAGLYFLSLIVGYLWGMAIGIALVLLGCLFLLLDLTRPQVAWRLPTKLAKSWMSRGVVGITLFVLIGVLHVLSLSLTPDAWTTFGMPWREGRWGLMFLGFLSGLGALFVATYPGFLLGNMRPLSLWNSAYIPALFLVSGLLGGFGFLYVLPFPWQALPWFAFLKNMGLILVVVELILISGLTWLSLPGATRESIALFTRGPFRYHFYLGLLGLGLIVPLVLLGLVSIGVGIVSFLFLEGILHLIGVFFLRYLIIKAGVRVSIN